MSLDRYFEIIKQYPEAFVNNSDLLTIIKDRDFIEAYMKEHKVNVGVVYESEFHTLIVDLVKDYKGIIRLYERILANDHAVIIIPKFKNQYILLRQYRHALRGYQYSFPRGFGEEGISSYENAVKEIQEEIGGEIRNLNKVSTIVANSGISGTKIDVYIANISSFHLNEGYEGIEEILLVDEEELLSMIKEDEINDSLTLSSLFLDFTKTKK